jgi:amino acid transporter
MGWNYVFQWAIVFPFELVVASLTVGYWNSSITPAAWITLFLVAVILVNVFGVLGFAEEEFWASVLKLIAIVVFMLIAFVLGKLKLCFAAIILADVIC